MDDHDDLIFPLTAFLEDTFRPIPEVTKIDGEAMPEPYRQLLVHEEDVVSTLERFHGGTIRLDVVNSDWDEDQYLREAFLLLDGSDRPVGYGASCIYLDRFPPSARELIIEGDLPLATILHDHGVASSLSTRAFFRIADSGDFDDDFGETFGAGLYGRACRIHNESHELLAETVELLPETEF